MISTSARPGRIRLKRPVQQRLGVPLDDRYRGAQFVGDISNEIATDIFDLFHIADIVKHCDDPLFLPSTVSGAQWGKQGNLPGWMVISRMSSSPSQLPVRVMPQQIRGDAIFRSAFSLHVADREKSLRNAGLTMRSHRPSM